MHFKIETLYTYGGDDAEWSEEIDGTANPMRFQTITSAQKELDEFFADVKEAVTAGHMDSEADKNDYRIVAAN